MASTSSSSSAASTSYVLPGQPLPPPPSSTAATTSSTGVYSRGEYLLSSLLGQPSYLKPASAKSSKSYTRQGSGTVTNGAAALQARVDTPLAPHLRLPEPDSVVLGRVTRITSRQATCSILLVLPSTSSNSSSTPAPTSAAQAGSTTRLSQTLASGRANHAAGEDPAGLDFSGVIRSQDVRLTETDKVKMGECFRVGDLVRARVISLGDSRSYYLSTASNELGVLFATVSTPADVLPSSSNSALLPSRLSNPVSASGESQQTGTAATAAGAGVVGVEGALRPLNWQEMVHPATGTREKRKVAKPDGV
ncbi:hypothetical protein BCV69DRAFT_257534 [Microstroma glucosiphilum]|uniref:Exosome complex component CSL4 C-terminal domain-containing protein n=1 Tax=Pseudomicrostroma glucosiphilum TaxID=1684307 RepID=A0A316UBT6_9BASI|nr:hypothetical protein BCV69DRAFT_257534 [Pseudomicrostroma glucosiphilum]PWN22592.1 hypothetical protein BCV69DRAFT_257534 [Pseudomicrostroma glucosiphilum]